MEKLLTIKDVSSLLHCGSKNRYVYELVSKGTIKCAKFGNKWLFKESDIKDFIDKQFEMQNKKTFI